jgi:hypothetical protein
MKHAQETVIALSTGDVSSGLERPLAVKVDIPSRFKNQEKHITIQRCKLLEQCILKH